MGPAPGEGTVSGRPAQATQRKGNISHDGRGVGAQDGLAPSGNGAKTTREEARKAYTRVANVEQRSSLEVQRLEGLHRGN